MDGILSAFSTPDSVFLSQFPFPIPSNVSNILLGSFRVHLS